MGKKKFTIHKKDVIINRQKLKVLLDNFMIDEKGMDYLELHRRISAKYGLDLSYKGFMSLLQNRSSWKLIYAYAIVDVLGVTIDEVFDVVDVDVEKTMKEKEEWIQKYQKPKLNSKTNNN